MGKSSPVSSKIHDTAAMPMDISTELDDSAAGATGCDKITKPKKAKGRDKAPAPGPSSDKAHRSGSRTEAVFARLDKLETMFERVMQAIPASGGSTQSGISLISDEGPVRSRTRPRELDEFDNIDYDVGKPDVDDDGSQYMDFDRDDDVSTHDHDAAAKPNSSKVVQDKVPQIAAKFAVAAEVGESIDEDIAETIAYMTSNKMEEKSLAEAAERYHCPDNCPLLDVPKVNASIWENLPSYARGKDLRLQTIQRSLTKGLNAFAHTLDPGLMSDTQQDVLALLCDANFALNCLRKDQIKPELNSNFQHLTKHTNKVTKFLFGDDLGRQVKDIEDQRKATAGVMRSRQGQQPPFHPYKRYGDPSRRPSQLKQAGWVPRDHSGNSVPRSGSSGRPFLGRRQWRGKPPHTFTPTAARADARQQPQPRRPGPGPRK